MHINTLYNSGTVSMMLDGSVTLRLEVITSRSILERREVAAAEVSADTIAMG